MESCRRYCLPSPVRDRRWGAPLHSVEVVQHCLAGLVHLEHNAAGCAAAGSHAEEITSRVRDQASVKRAPPRPESQGNDAAPYTSARARLLPR